MCTAKLIFKVTKQGKIKCREKHFYKPQSEIRFWETCLLALHLEKKKKKFGWFRTQDSYTFSHFNDLTVEIMDGWKELDTIFNPKDEE